MTEIREAWVKETGEAVYTVAINVSGYALVGDEPTAAGGSDHGPNPFDYLLTALGTCTVMTLRWVARQQNIPLVKAQARIRYEKREGKNHFTQSIAVEGPELTIEHREKLLRAASHCPVHKVLTAENIVEASWLTELGA